MGVVHSPMDSMVHSPIEVSSLSPDQLHITPIATIDGRTGPGQYRRRRSVREGPLDGGASGGGCGGAPHAQLARTRLFPLGPAAPIDRMPHVQFRPNGTIFDCELGCFIPLEEYQRRRSKESLNKIQEEAE